MITVRCLVDNTVRRGSALWGEHGASFAIETPKGQVLFDVGQSGEVLLHNAVQMGVQLKQIDALAISHAHFDHTGGLAKVLMETKHGIPIYANPSLFQMRYARKNDQTRSIGLQITQGQLSQYADLRLSANPIEIIPGVWTTGEILDRPEFDGSSSQHYIYKDGKWAPDPYLDDMSLVLETKEGLVVVCGCCHAGLLNTLSHIKRTFQKNVLAIMGGTHLESATNEALNYAITVMQKHFNEKIPNLYLNHCTGERAYFVLTKSFGNQVQPFPVGMMYNFE